MDVRLEWLEEGGVKQMEEDEEHDEEDSPKSGCRRNTFIADEYDVEKRVREEDVDD